MAPKLPHLKTVLVDFVVGTLETWKWFTSEFEEGGDIDNLSAAGHELAWMPPTNDANEGILGAFHVYMCSKPRTTLHKFNAQAMFDKKKHKSSWMQSLVRKIMLLSGRKPGILMGASWNPKGRKQQLIMQRKSVI
jgi:hypothetical protein